MNETYEVSLLRNVHAVDEKSSISQEFAGLKRKQSKEKRKKGVRYGSGHILRPMKHGVYDSEAFADDDKDEGKVDITV